MAGKPGLRYALESPPVERYDVNIGKLQSVVSVPQTDATIRRFVRGYVSPLAACKK